MEAVRGGPAVCAPRRCGGRADRAGPLRDQGQAACWGQADAARSPEDRVYTVISGVFYIGLGEHFDSAKLEAYPPGSVIVLPGGTPHFHWERSGDYVTQVTAIGPLGLEYVDPDDDPRKH